MSGNELEPSELGTKEYWEDTYSSEIKNFKDFGDVGEIWFGNGCAARIIQWLNTSNTIPKTENVIDLGCGNGMLLIKLAKNGWTNLMGVDYSAHAIDLATCIANAEGLEITYRVWDILSEMEISWPDQFGLALDKGTYDAISLSPGNRTMFREKYMKSVRRMLKSGGLLLLTSCNWTEEELKMHFSSAGQVFPGRCFEGQLILHPQGAEDEGRVDLRNIGDGRPDPVENPRDIHLL